MIRIKLGYKELIWSLHKKKHVLILERIQRIATKLVPELKNQTRGKIKINSTKHT